MKPTVPGVPIAALRKTLDDDARQIQAAHDAAVATVKRYIRRPDAFDYALAHRIVEAVFDATTLKP